MEHVDSVYTHKEISGQTLGASPEVNSIDLNCLEVTIKELHSHLEGIAERTEQLGDRLLGALPPTDEVPHLSSSQEDFWSELQTCTSLAHRITRALDRF